MYFPLIRKICESILYNVILSQKSGFSNSTLVASVVGEGRSSVCMRGWSLSPPVGARLWIGGGWEVGEGVWRRGEGVGWVKEGEVEAEEGEMETRRDRRMSTRAGLDKTA